MKTVVVHDGSFHSDDVFAIATLQLIYGTEQLTIIRSRDESIIADADMVVDVGMIYDPEKYRFDHHQGGAPIRENGIPYAAFGLVWEKFGQQLTTPYAADLIEKTLVQPIDAGDNGVELYTLTSYNVQPAQLYSVVSSYLPITDKNSQTYDAGFSEAVLFARGYLKRLIGYLENQELEYKKALQLYQSATDKTLLVADELIDRNQVIDFVEPLVLVTPQERPEGIVWRAYTINLNRNTFATRVKFPSAWAGLRDEELVTVSGIAGAQFCHRNRFLFVCDSKQGAITAAQAAIKNGQQ